MTYARRSLRHLDRQWAAAAAAAPNRRRKEFRQIALELAQAKTRIGCSALHLVISGTAPAARQRAMATETEPASAPTGSLRPNYSCGSLAAAEQLEALMRHRTNGAEGCTHAALQGFAGGAADALGAGALNGGSCASLGCGGYGGSSHETSEGGGGSTQQQLSRSMDAQSAMMSLLQGSGDASALMRGYGYGGGEGMGGGGGGMGMLGMGMGAQGLAAQGSPLSLLHYAGSAALGGGMPGGGGYSPVADQNGEQQQARPAARCSPPRNFSGGRSFRAPSSPRVSPDSGTRSPPPPVLARAQKRRFVWTPDLHSRFEAAVNALGLDNAKPKSILRLMNVDGLTKANIKSHLQKYRCLVQKRAAQAAANGGAPPAQNGRGGSLASSEAAAPRAPAAASSAQPQQGVLPSPAPNGVPPAHLSVAEQVQQGYMPEAMLSQQGGCSLQRNLEVQEMTLKVQMDLQEELSRQLQLQKRLQAEMEGMMEQRAVSAPPPPQPPLVRLPPHPAPRVLDPLSAPNLSPAAASRPSIDRATTTRRR